MESNQELPSWLEAMAMESRYEEGFCGGSGEHCRKSPWLTDLTEEEAAALTEEAAERAAQTSPPGTTEWREAAGTAEAEAVRCKLCEFRGNFPD